MPWPTSSTPSSPVCRPRRATSWSPGPRACRCSPWRRSAPWSTATSCSPGTVVVVAQHYLDAVAAAGPTDPEVPRHTRRARELLVRAAERATSLGSPAEAGRLYESALACADDERDRADLHTRGARAALDAGEFERARDL